MRIKNIDGFSAEQLQEEVKKGGKFVFYNYTFSLIVMTFRRTSGVYLVRGNENAVTRGLPFTFLTFFFGWWGVPYGPKYTVESIRTNLSGGKDVTEDVMATVAGHILFREAEKEKENRYQH